MHSTAALFSTFALFSSALGAQYNLRDAFVGQAFLKGFSHQATNDPTQGRMNFVDQQTALAQNLSFATADTFIMRADSFAVVPPTAAGRNSVRIQSNNQYTTHVSVYDIRHMPEGCGTWPSVVEVGQNWPAEGEVDIIEGANDVGPNQSSLLTTSDCAMPASLTMTGKQTSTDCSVVAPVGFGCGVRATNPTSYGKAFNAAGGGFYAMERTPTFIKVWFWSRSDPTVPADVQTAGAGVNTDTWGTPTALFVNDKCDMNTHFGPHNIVISLAFCGEGAGGALFTSAGCPGTCEEFVDNVPNAFADAFWDIAGVHVYE